MHPALRLYVRLMAGLFLAVVLASLLAACGGGGDACAVEHAGPASRTLDYAAPVAVLHSVAVQPAAGATVSATLTVTLSGTGTHSVLLRLTSAAPGRPATIVGNSVEVLPGASRQVTLTGHVPAGAQTLSVAYALIGTDAQGKTLASAGAQFDVCETTDIPTPRVTCTATAEVCQ